jgi:hypothetical protein
MSRVILHITAACCVLAGCGPKDQTADDATVDDAAAAAAGADSVFAPAEDRVNLPSSRIYYTLTSYEWYARGEPLVHDGRPYEPEGMPVNASLTEMTKVGEYGGVEYYVHDGDPEPSVYVPVFEGYWQRFRADPSAIVSPAAVDGAAPVDSSTAFD